MINRPLEEVFAAFSDARTQPQWDPGLLKGVHEPDAPIRLGTKITEIRKILGRTTETRGEIIQFEANKHYVRQGSSAGIMLTGYINFEPIGDSTRILWRWELESSGFLSLVRPIMEVVFKMNGEKLLANFKQLMESGNFIPR